MMMNRFLAAVVAAGAVSASFAHEFRETPIVAHWTGAANGDWADARNWDVEDWQALGVQEHMVPGLVTNYVGGALVCTGCKSDQAVFDRATTKTSVSPAKIACISNVTFRGTSVPKISFSGRFPFGSGARLLIESDVAEAPQMNVLSLCAFYATSEMTAVIENNSASEFVLTGCWGYSEKDPLAPSLSNPKCNLYLRGTGDIFFKVNQTKNVTTYFHFQQNGGKFTCSSPWKPQLQIVSDEPNGLLQKIEIPFASPKSTDADPNLRIGKFAYYATGGNTGLSVTASDLQITGEGEFYVPYTEDKNTKIQVDSGRVLTVDSVIHTNGTKASSKIPALGAAFRLTGGGVMRVTCPTNDIGVIEVENGVLETTTIGMSGTVAPLGLSDGIFSGVGGTYRYTGTGETTDRRIYLSTTGAAARFEQCGTGDLTLSSDEAIAITDTSTTANHILSLVNTNAAVRGIFARPVPDISGRPLIVAVNGTGGWRFCGDQTTHGIFRIERNGTAEFADVSAITSPIMFNGGGSRMRIVGGTDEVKTVAISLVTNMYDTANLEIVGKANVTIDEAYFTSGCTLNISAPDAALADGSASVTVTRRTGNPKMTLNGLPVRFEDGGKVVYDGEKITGDRDVVVSGKDRYLMAYDNDYTGRTILYGAAGAYIYALRPTSIPDYAKVFAYDTRITVPVVTPGGEAAWSDAQILDLANKATLVSANGVTNAVIAVDTTASGDHTLALDDTKVTNPEFGIGSDGANTLTVTGEVSTPVNFAAYHGTLRFSGQRNLRLGGGAVTGDYNDNDFGTVVFDGVKATLSDDDDPIVVGGARGKTGTTAQDKYRGKLVIRNSQLTNGMMDKPIGTNRNIVLGGMATVGTAVMEIEGDETSVISAITVGNEYASRVAVYQKGGDVANWASGDNGNSTMKPMFGYNGSSYWELQKGSYSQLGSVWWGSNQDMTEGIFAQFGGKALFTSRSGGNIWSYSGGRQNGTHPTRRDSPISLIYQRGGFAIVSNITWRVCATENYTNGMAEVTLDGPTAEFVIDKTCTPQFCWGKGGRLTFNLNDGGTLVTAKALVLYRSPIEAGALPRELIVSFNGGRIRPTDNLALFGAADSDKRATRVTVYENGAIFDTNGKTVTLNVPLTAPTGQGVRTVTVNNANSSVKSFGMVGAPGIYVQPMNGGDYTCVFPEFDPVQGIVTNVRVTCSGYGYTAVPTVDLRYRNSRNSGTDFVTATLGEVTGGGLVKEGEGTLVLGVANSYAGETTVKGGVLKLAAEGALPSVKVNLAGGTLDVADGVSYPDGLTFDVSALSFEPGAKHVLASHWPSEKALPSVTGIPQGSEFQLRHLGTTLKLKEPVGALLIVR